MSEPPAPPDLLTSLHVEGDRRVLRVSGELDLMTAPVFQRALAEGLQGGGDLLVDLRDVGFMDSTGLRALLEARRRMEGTGAVIRLSVSPDGPVSRLLDLAGVAHLFGGAGNGAGAG